MDIRPRVCIKDYPTKEDAFLAAKEMFDKGLYKGDGFVIDSAGSSKEDSDWVLRELAAYRYFEDMDWDVLHDRSLEHDFRDLARFYLKLGFNETL